MTKLTDWDPVRVWSGWDTGLLQIKTIDNIQLSTEIIFENFKDHSKITCNIDKIKLGQFNQKMIDLVKIGLK